MSGVVTVMLLYCTMHVALIVLTLRANHKDKP